MGEPAALRYDEMDEGEQVDLWLRALAADLGWMGMVIRGRAWPSPQEQIVTLSRGGLVSLSFLAGLLGRPDPVSLYGVPAIDNIDREKLLAIKIEDFRKALMVAHAHDWDMETVSEAAHICARAMYPGTATPDRAAQVTDVGRGSK